jgi:putative DNA primase/helicase
MNIAGTDFETDLEILPDVVWESIESARRVMDDTIGRDAVVLNFQRMARDLMQLRDNCDEPWIKQHIADAAFNIGEQAGLDANAIQGILDGVTKPSLDAPPLAPREPDVLPPEFSDDALALQFAELHADHLRYVHTWGKWYSWDKTRWSSDETLQTYDRVRETCRSASTKKEKLASLLASAKTVAAVERLSRSDRRLAATIDQWDVDKWILNTPTGVVDLRTGRQRQHCAEDYLTKITAVAPDAACPTPTWLAFLNRVTGGKSELVDFLQRMAGYSLTGETIEHALFFLYGTGANGKTTFLNAITGCTGEYQSTAPIETFTDSKNERHPTDLAGLRGARLVTAVETEEGRRWAESKIKALTGGDKISARFMRQDFFEYTPQFKLIIAGNHKPGLRSVDEAIRRRFHLVPFTVTIPPKERDTNLPAKLKAELPGILAWMIQGCLDWQQRGLTPPQIVTDATDAYLESQDAISAWLEECCESDPNGGLSRTTLFESWSKWAATAGEHIGTRSRFLDAMELRFEAARRGGAGRGFRGVRLKPPMASDWTGDTCDSGNCL